MNWTLIVKKGDAFVKGAWTKTESAQLVDIRTGEVEPVDPSQARAIFLQRNNVKGAPKIVQKTVTTYAIRP